MQTSRWVSNVNRYMYMWVCWRSTNCQPTVDQVLIEYQLSMIYQWRCWSSADRYVSQVFIEGTLERRWLSKTSNLWCGLNLYSILFFSLVFYFYICLIIFLIFFQLQLTVLYLEIVLNLSTISFRCINYFGFWQN